MKSIFDINTWISSSLGFSRGIWAIVAAVLLVLLVLLFLGALRRGHVKGRQMFIETGWTALWYYGLVLFSLITYWPWGEKIPLWKPGNPLLFWAVAAIIIIALYIWYFRKRKKHFADQVSANAIRKSAAGSGASKYCYALLFAGMLVASIISWVRLACGDSVIHLVVPMLLVVLTLFLYNLSHWRAFFFAGAVLLLGYAVLMIQNMLAVTNSEYTPLLAMVPLYLSAILPLVSLSFVKMK